MEELRRVRDASGQVFMTRVQTTRQRVGIVCPKCGMHPVRTISTCEQVADRLNALGPRWRDEVERSLRGLLLAQDVTMEDMARGYVLVDRASSG